MGGWRWIKRTAVAVAMAAGSLFPAGPLPAQGQDRVLTIIRGQSELLSTPTNVRRVSVGDPEVADAVVVSGREVLINGRTVGTTTLIVWDITETRRTYTVEVTINAAALQRNLRTLFPGEQVTAIASGNAVVLSGTVSDASVARRMVEFARGGGATVIDNISSPAAPQVLLRVRFAEVSRRAALDLGTEYGARNVGQDSEGIFDNNEVTLADGLVRIFLSNSNVDFEAVIQALKTRGHYRSLAEPNLLARDGQEAYFLAGGEFPVPTPQPGQGGNGLITVVFKEFGIRLRFTPTSTASGRIRLRVAPEVSQLDFTTGVRLSGFEIPSFITRRAETEVELRPGQTLAIAGLMDNTLIRNASKIPLLGDIPILGYLFQSREIRDNKTELLVLVTPELVTPSDTAPPVPTGEPSTWRRDRAITEPARP